MSDSEKFEIVDGELKKYMGKDDVVVIPDGVTSIGDSAFEWCSNLKSITIPDSVTSIGDSAFSWCSSLTSITIPNGVTSIGYGVFQDCKSLTSITIPDSVTSIGDSAFSCCSSLTSITIPDSVTSIGSSAFNLCSSLKSISIPNGVTRIEGETFSNCSSLTSITIPNGVTRIGKQAFSGCSSLMSVTIPDSVEIIESFAFAYCKQLEEISIPNDLCLLLGGSFESSGLKRASVPVLSRLEDYGISSWYPNGVFENCANLTEIIFTTASKGDISFAGSRILCSDKSFKGTPLEKVYAPLCDISFLKYIKPQAAAGFAELFLDGEHIDESIAAGYHKYINTQKKRLYELAVKTEYLLRYMIDKKIIPAADVQKCIEFADKFSKTEMKALLLAYSNDEEVVSNSELKLSVSIPRPKDPNSIVEMKKVWSFEKVKGNKIIITGYKGAETEVVVPSEIGGMPVFAIGSCAFSPEQKRVRSDLASSREKIVSVVIPEGVEIIGEYLFHKCRSLRRISFPQSLKGIKSLEYDYGLKDSCPLIEDAPILGAGLYLENIETSSPVLTVIDGMVIYGDMLVLATADVPADCVIPKSVKIIGDRAFENRSKIKTVNIINEKAVIWRYAFAGCSSLESINIPSGNKIIEIRTFSECSSLKNIVIPDSTERIRKGAFNDCTSLEEIIIPDKVKYIEEYAFSRCTNLAMVTLGKNLKSVGNRSFYNTIIKKLRITSNLNSFGENAFANCEELQDVYIEDGVKDLGYHTFAFDKNIKEVRIPSEGFELDSLDKPFYGCSKDIRFYS